MHNLSDTSIPQVSFRKNAKDFEFEILRLEELFSRKNRLPIDIEQPHRVQFYHIFLITEGTGKHHIDFISYPFSPGDLIFVSQGQVHSFEVHPDVCGYVIVFTAEYLKINLIHSDIVSLYRLYNYHLSEPVIRREDSKREDFLTIFKEIGKEYWGSDQFAGNEILRLLLKVLLLKAERVKRTIGARQKNTEWFDRFDQFRELLGKHHTATRNVHEYAKMLKMSAKHLNTICKSISGTTAKQCIDSFIVLEIKRVLATSNSSIQEISYEFGFDEPTNFVKFFKKHNGQSPTKFRNSFTK